MRSLFVPTMALLLGLGATHSLQADLFKNSDFSSDIADWYGNGRMVNLNADGTEADNPGPKTLPAIKLRLRHDAQSIYQEFEMRDNPTQMDIHVDVMGAADFKRSPDRNDYGVNWSAGGTWYWSAIVVPNADFWIQGAPGYFYKLGSVVMGRWTTLTGHFENLKSADKYRISFCVPPGEGAVYIKNPSASVSP